MMPLGKTKNGATILEISAHVSSIWAKGCVLDDCMCVYLT